jgi:hypothetical protein
VDESVEVRDLYFRDIDEVRRDCIIEEVVDYQWEDHRFEEGRRVADEEECHQELQSYREDTTF